MTIGADSHDSFKLYQFDGFGDYIKYHTTDSLYAEMNASTLQVDFTGTPFKNMKKFIFKSYYKKYYKNNIPIKTELIRTTPYIGRYGIIEKPKNFREINATTLITYDSKGRVIKSCDVLHTNNCMKYTYANNMIEIQTYENGVLISILKEIYKRHLINKKIISYRNGGITLLPSDLLIKYSIVYDNKKKIKSFFVEEYQDDVMFVTYDENGIFVGKIPEEYEYYRDENGTKKVRIKVQKYPNLNFSPKIRYEYKPLS